MKLILNLLTVPIKAVLLVPTFALSLVISLAGYDEASDVVCDYLFIKWFD